jgi:hypothetical protein
MNELLSVDYEGMANHCLYYSQGFVYRCGAKSFFPARLRGAEALSQGWQGLQADLG